MNKDQVKGRMEEAKGSIKETTGKAVNSEKLKQTGRADQAAGKAQAAYGDAKNQVKKAVDKS